MTDRKSQQQPVTVSEVVRGASYPRLKLWGFRLVSVVLAPVVFLLLVEGLLRVAGYGESMAFTRGEEVSGRDCRVPNQAFGWKYFPKDIAREAAWFAYPEDKPDDAIRIFVLGGSAAQGDPEPVHGVSRQMQAMLQVRYPGKRIEVVNAAMTAINSHVVRDIASEVVRQDADLLVIYMGNNEVVGPFGASNPLLPLTDNLGLIRASLWAKSTRMGQLGQSVLRGLTAAKPSETRWRGMEMFLEHEVAVGDPRLQSVQGHFRRNLEAILADAHGVGVPVVLSTVAVNLADCAPFASQHGAGLPDADLDRWQLLFEEGVAKEDAGDAAAALAAWRQAEGIDSGYAELHYRMGKAYLKLGHHDTALQHLVRARDLDTLRFRADSSINGIIRDLARSKFDGVYLVDSEQRFIESVTHGLPGRSLFYEHVHFTFAGNHLLASTLLESIEPVLKAKLGAPGGAWLTATQCADRLAYTPYDEYTTLQLVLGRVGGPPFTHQCDIDEQTAYLETRSAQLVADLKGGDIEHCRQVYAQAVEQSPNDDWLQFFHGYFLLNGVGDVAAAQSAFGKARQLGLETTALWLGAGMAHYRQGQLKQAIEAFRAGLEMEPRNWRLHSQLGFALNQKKNVDEAIEHCRLAVELAPDVAEVHTNLGLVLMDNGKLESARGSFEKAIELGGDSAACLVNLGMVLAAGGHREQAIERYTSALALDPGDFRANREMGRLMLISGSLPAALGHFDHANRARPEDMGIANDLAWLLATIADDSLRDGQRALQLATKVCRATDHRDPALLDTLAAAYAECRQFERAVSIAEKAVSIATDAGLKGQVSSRLKLYQQGRPFREAASQ